MLIDGALTLNSHELLFAVQRAVRAFYDDKLVWDNIRQNDLKCDFSWNRSAKAYNEIYEVISICQCILICGVRNEDSKGSIYNYPNRSEYYLTILNKVIPMTGP